MSKRVKMYASWLFSTKMLNHLAKGSDEFRATYQLLIAALDFKTLSVDRAYVEALIEVAPESLSESISDISDEVPDDLNAMMDLTKNGASPDELKSISQFLFGDSHALQLLWGASVDGRPELKGRALYVTNSMEVVLHETMSGDQVIEFKRKV